MSRPMSARLVAQLDARCEMLGWTIAELASAAGCHENTIARVIHGANVNLGTLVTVAEALGFRVELETGAALGSSGGPDEAGKRGAKTR